MLLAVVEEVVVVVVTVVVVLVKGDEAGECREGGVVSNASGKVAIQMKGSWVR
jgi:hypothetical protein